MDIDRDRSIGIVHRLPADARGRKLKLPFIATARLTRHRLTRQQDTGCAAAVKRVALHSLPSGPGSAPKPTRRVRGLFPIALWLLISGSNDSSAEILGNARIGFTAERVLVLDGRRFV